MKISFGIRAFMYSQGCILWLWIGLRTGCPFVNFQGALLQWSSLWRTGRFSIESHTIYLLYEQSIPQKRSCFSANRRLLETHNNLVWNTEWSRYLVSCQPLPLYILVAEPSRCYHGHSADGQDNQKYWIDGSALQVRSKTITWELSQNRQTSESI